jgi:FMN phosphatase YigB (HAD superfamily)
MIKVVFFDLGETLVTQNRKWVAGGRALLEVLRNRNLRLGIISNTGEMTKNQLKQELPADFDFTAFEKELVILSAEAGVKKPDPQIFQMAADKSGISAGECLFVTENAVDALAAQKIGLKALRLLPPPASDIAETDNYLIKAGFAV